MTKIIFFDVQDYEKEFLEKNFRGEYDIILVEDPVCEVSTITQNMKDAEIISCFTSSCATNEILSQFPELQLIALRSVGYNHVDLDYCNEHNITVVNAPNYGNRTVAEFAFGLLINVARHITRAYNEFRQDEVAPQNTVGIELFDKTIGIVGLGAIGAEMARISYGFGMKILGYDIKENQALVEKFGVKYTTLDDLLNNSDVITLHAPLTKDNYHLINAESFEKMKDTAILINTARGRLVDTQALYNALINKQIAGAGLDVLECEEAISNPDYLLDLKHLSSDCLKNTVLNNRLMNLPNVIITPHIAYDTKEAVHRILEITMSNINAFMNGNVQNKVN